MSNRYVHYPLNFMLVDGEATPLKYFELQFDCSRMVLGFGQSLEKMVFPSSYDDIAISYDGWLAFPVQWSTLLLPLIHK